MGIGLNGSNPEDKSKIGQEDKQVTRIICFTWISQIVILKGLGALIPYHLHFFKLVAIFIYL